MKTIPVSVRVALAGDLSSYLPEHHKQCYFLQHTQTASSYALYALKKSDGSLRPALRYIPQGDPITLNLWEMPLHLFTLLVLEIETPLAMGDVQLRDGRWVKGFIFEDYALNSAVEISQYGSWQHYREMTMSNTRFECQCIGEIRN